MRTPFEVAIHKQVMVHELENNLDRFPLPIYFDPREEQKALARRKMRIVEIVDRLFSLYKLNP